MPAPPVRREKFSAADARVSSRSSRGARSFQLPTPGVHEVTPVGAKAVQLPTPALPLTLALALKDTLTLTEAEATPAAAALMQATAFDPAPWT